MAGKSKTDSETMFQLENIGNIIIVNNYSLLIYKVRLENQQPGLRYKCNAVSLSNGQDWFTFDSENWYVAWVPTEVYISIV